MNILEILSFLHISYEVMEHEAVYTVEDAKKISHMIDGVGCKNLFLTDGKKYYLVILRDDKRLDMKKLSLAISSKHLSFTSPKKLQDILNLTPGSVTPFGIIHDVNHEVIVVIDSDLKNQKLLFHPNINTKTLSISFDDLIRFLEYEKNKYLFF